MYKYLFLSMLIMVVSYGQSQQLFTKDSEITLEFDKFNTAFFKYKIANENILSSLCKLTLTTDIEIRKLNNLPIKKIENKEIKVPVDFAAIVRSKTEVLAKKGIYIPIFYYVRKGDTYYKLAKTYGGEEVESFMKRNKLIEPSLKLDTKVNMGWLYVSNDSQVTKASQIPVNKIIEDKREIKSYVIPVKNEKKIVTKEQPLNVKAILSQKPINKSNEATKIVATLPKPSQIKKDTIHADEAPLENKFAWTNTKGIAYWQPSHRRSSGKYVLHSSAPINSIVKLYNPMLKRTVDAKVIGRIPKETYRKDVDIVISPAIAESLGALDSRFMVELTYRN